MFECVHLRWGIADFVTCAPTAKASIHAGLSIFYGLFSAGRHHRSRSRGNTYFRRLFADVCKIYCAPVGQDVSKNALMFSLNVRTQPSVIDGSDIATGAVLVFSALLKM